MSSNRVFLDTHLLPKLNRYRRLISTSDDDAQHMHLYFKDDRLLGWCRFTTPAPASAPPPDPDPSEQAIREMLARRLAATDDPVERYVIEQNLRILSSRNPHKRALLLQRPRRNSRPRVHNERDAQVVRWMAWARALGIPKPELTLGAFFGLGSERIRAIAKPANSGLALRTADTSVSLQAIYARMRPGEEERFALPLGLLTLKKVHKSSRLMYLRFVLPKSRAGAFNMDSFHSSTSSAI